VKAFFASIFGYFLSPIGLVALAALDSSMLFFLPFAVDAAVIILTARRPEWAFVFPVLAAAGSLVGAAVTFWIGRRGGEHGLEHFMSARRLEAVKRQVKRRGAVAMAIPGVLPPPFPLTPFVLACGALEVSRTRFFGTLGAVRLLRFGVESWLATRYGRGILVWLQSPVFYWVIGALAVVAVVGTVAGIWALYRRARTTGRGAPRPAA
jgi:membrane protein YqaA with SNARE-associated domain